MNLNGTYGWLSNRTTEQLVLPELKKLTLWNGGFIINFETPNLEILDLAKINQIDITFKSLPKLEQISVVEPGRDEQVWLAEIFKQAINVKEVTLTEAWEEYRFPNLFPWKQIESLTMMSDNFNYSSLKYLFLEK